MALPELLLAQDTSEPQARQASYDLLAGLVLCEAPAQKAPHLGTSVHDVVQPGSLPGGGQARASRKLRPPLHLCNGWEKNVALSSMVLRFPKVNQPSLWLVGTSKPRHRHQGKKPLRISTARTMPATLARLCTQSHTEDALLFTNSNPNEELAANSR